MTPQEAADQLTGGEYRKEGSKELFAAMKAAGLVAVYGASDDLMEFEGAVYNEVGAPGTAYFTKAGLLLSECSDEECPYFEKEKKKASAIHAKRASKFLFVYETDIPHVKFIINEDGEPYCEGIVFALADVTGAETSVSPR